MSRSKLLARALRVIASRNLATTVLDLLGAAAVVCGVALVYMPAAFVVAGGAVLYASHVLAADPAVSFATPTVIEGEDE